MLSIFGPNSRYVTGIENKYAKTRKYMKSRYVTLRIRECIVFSSLLINERFAN